METKLLRKSKRKLSYLSERPSCNWREPLSQMDFDKMFDSDVGATSGPAVLLEKHSQENLSGLEIISRSPLKPVTDELDDAIFEPATRSPHYKLDFDLDIPFKAHGPVKTSSPIEQIMSKKPDDESSSAVFPVLFNFEAEAAEEPDKNPPNIQKPQCNGRVTENSDDDDGESESPPSKVTLTKKSFHKKAVKASSSQEHTEPCVPAVRQEPEGSAVKNVSGNVPKRPSVGKDMTVFLQKVKHLIQSKPPKNTAVKVDRLPPPPPPPPPEPEDDFCILEDDTPLWVSIPSKSATKKRQKLSKTFNSDKESFTERELKESSVDVLQEEEQELEMDNNKPESQAVVQKTNARKKSNEKNMESENCNEGLPGPEEFPDPMEQQEPKKKKQLRKVSSERSMEPEEVPAGDPLEQQEPKKNKKLKVSSKQSDDLESRAGVALPKKTEPKKQKSTRKKILKEDKEISPTTRTDSLKKSRKRLQGPAAVASEADGENQEPAGTEHLGSFSDTEEADGETKQKQSAESRESSSEDVFQKRRRRQTGQWWLSPLSVEEAENPLPPKKSKQNNSREPGVAPSMERVKKDKTNKRSNQKLPGLLPSDHTDITKESKRKQTKKRKTKGEKVKETDEIINAAEEEEEQIPDQEESSPLVFTHRDLSLNTGARIFHQVYHHSSSENISVPSTAAEEDQPRDAEPAKRRRKPPSNWWEVNGAADVSGSASSRPQQLHRTQPTPKRKEQKKQPKQQKSGLGTPKNGNVAAGSEPPGGAPVPLLKLPSSPKTVKSSLASFKDIFTSTVGIPTADADKDAHQSTTRGVSSRPAEKDAEFVTGGGADGDGLCGDVDECRGTQHSHETPEDGEFPSEDTLRLFKSGPSSLIELENYEDNDDTDLPTTRVQMLLSVSDLCAPPLKPLTLHSKDKSGLNKWFQSLWSSTGDDDAVVTPDHFQWYFYKNRALGIQADLNSACISYGKILMGSYMKKPLWVDHSATTYFNLLTSSVSVTVDGKVSRYNPGQAFMVECGRAYSIHNTNAQPAVLYFTRILAESSD